MSNPEHKPPIIEDRPDFQDSKAPPQPALPGADCGSLRIPVFLSMREGSVSPEIVASPDPAQVDASIKRQVISGQSKWVAVYKLERMYRYKPTCEVQDLSDLVLPTSTVVSVDAPEVFDPVVAGLKTPEAEG